MALLFACVALILLYWRWSAVGGASEGSMVVQPSYVGKLSFLALGDSYTIGESVEPADRWPMQLAAAMRKNGIDLSDPVIIARTGWTTGDLLAAMNRAKLTDKFDLVMILIGVNNQFQGRSEEEYRQQFAELLKRAVVLSGGKVSHVVVLSIPDWSVMPFGQHYDSKRVSSEIDRSNAICREETNKIGAGYVNVTGISRGATTRPDLVAADGLHPSGTQYGEWVDAAIAAAKLAVTAP
jgi:lysophospholipase L1-like esterase